MKPFKGIFQKKDIMECSSEKTCLIKTFGPIGLILLGIGAIIGAGIFVITGIASAVAGPSLIFSFIGAGVVCGFIALCYAELGSMITLTGGIYTYVQVSLGELGAWIVGWSVLLQIIVTAATVAIGWSSYTVGFIKSIGLNLPDIVTYSPLTGPGIINLPAFLIVIGMMVVVLLGVKSSKKVNTVIVITKLVAIIVFVIVGAQYINPQNYHPFMPNGIYGVFQGAAMVFFAYLGFDAVAAASEETKNPQRAVPIGIIGSLILCGILYIIVTLVLTGMLNYSQYAGVSAPIQYALNAVGANWMLLLVTAGTITGLTTVVLVSLYLIPRVIYSMSRDGLLPIRLTRIHPKFKIPVFSIVISGFLIGLLAAFFPLREIFELANISALTTFVFLAIGVIELRRACPNIPRKVKCPFVPVLPIVTIIICLILISQLKITTLIYFGLWTIAGLGFYFTYKKFKR
jgi:basic amino acid/polyamine antiporter, APA family